jgi:hypothetical protein
LTIKNQTKNSVNTIPRNTPGLKAPAKNGVRIEAKTLNTGKKITN